MAVPRIVFCPNQHIYDASIYSSCPYCKKIAEEQKELEHTLGGDRKAGLSEKYRSDRPADIREDADDEDATELLDVTENEDDSRAKLRIEADEGNRISGMETLPVLGWLVCNEGLEEGRSFELRGNDIMLYAENSRYVFTEGVYPQGRLLAEISYSKDNRLFRLKPAQGVSCRINRHPILHESIVKSYDVIQLESHEFLLVMLLTAFVKWGD